MEHEESRPRRSGPWAKVGALLYDPFLWAAELAGMRRRRRALLAGARGRILELGAGTGLNLVHYPAGVGKLVLVEPEPAMHRRLSARLRRSPREGIVVAAGAEALPFADRSFDTVVCTLVLCTVIAPDAALGEIRRVLAPEGQLLFIEHVRSDSPTLAALQDRLLRPWQRFACGCRCNRDTVEMMRAGGFEVTTDRAVWYAMPPIVRPLITGRAVPAADAHTRQPAVH
jgi:ubiquinone/menaquinone biosynthesis C-methylase UbiE